MNIKFVMFSLYIDSGDLIGQIQTVPSHFVIKFQKATLVTHEGFTIPFQIVLKSDFHPISQTTSWSPVSFYKNSFPSVGGGCCSRNPVASPPGCAELVAWFSRL